MGMETIESRIWSERWRLAVLSQAELIKIGLASAIIGLLFFVFNYQGNTLETHVFGRSSLWWMWKVWEYMGGDFSHGPLIPVVSLAVLWVKRNELIAAPKSTSSIGLFLVITALLMHWVGLRSQQTRLSLMALGLLIWAVPFYLYGWRVAKALIFPCAYLLFCIPMNFLDSMTFPLRMFAASASTVILNGLGIEAEQVGSAIYSTAAGGFNFDVADPCSGIRSLLAMTALTAVYAYFTQKTFLKRWILFLSSIPLAIIGNIARIVTIALMAEAFGEKIALTLYHDYSGYVVFAVAIGFMVALGSLMNIKYREEWRAWKHANLSHTSS